MKPILIVAGGGPSGRAIAERCSTRWRVTVIDLDAGNLELFATDDVAGVAGDCTSTLTLNKTPIERASAVVAATGSDEVNFEFCRLAREIYKIKNVVALVSEVEEATNFQSHDYVAITRPSSAAAIVEVQLDSGRRTTTDIGLGVGEIMEVTVQTHSPVIGKTLAVLRPKSWLLGAIYREGKLVVPHGTTEIEENDRCLLIGEPSILSGIADYFQRGSSEFPLQFGTRYAVLDTHNPVVLSEAKYWLERTNATGIRVLTKASSAGESVDLAANEDDLDIAAYQIDHNWPQNLDEVGDTLDLAAHFVEPKSFSWLQKFGLSKFPVFPILEKTSEPVVVARGTFPYKSILLAVSPGTASVRVAELAVDVARKLGAKLTVAVACPAEHVTGKAFREDAEEALEKSLGLASLYGLGTSSEILEGNSVNQVCQRAKDFDLLIVGHRRGRRFSLIKPDVSALLAARSPISTMILPYQRKDLVRAYTRRVKKNES